MYLFPLITAHIGGVPVWLQTPDWFWPATRAVGHVVRAQPAFGLFAVILAEELGVPLPAPGDAAIMYGGYLTSTGVLPTPLAYLAVVSGATIGAFCNYTICRRFGHPFLVRFGPYVGLTAERLESAERAFRRWGPWAVLIGRHVPGMRIVLSAFAGVFELPRALFVPCVLISSTIWAAIFLELGRAVGRNSRLLFRLVPAHLLPPAFVLLALAWALWLLYEHRWRPRRQARRRAEQRSSDRVQSNNSLPPKAEGRTAKM